MTGILSQRYTHTHRVKGESLNTVHAERARFWPFIRRHTISTDFPTHLLLLYFNRMVM